MRDRARPLSSRLSGAANYIIRIFSSIFFPCYTWRALAIIRLHRSLFISSGKYVCRWAVGECRLRVQKTCIVRAGGWR